MSRLLRPRPLALIAAALLLISGYLFSGMAEYLVTGEGGDGGTAWARWLAILLPFLPFLAALLLALWPDSAALAALALVIGIGAMLLVLPVGWGLGNASFVQMMQTALIPTVGALLLIAAGIAGLGWGRGTP